MVVNQLHFVGVAPVPPETDAILLVDPNTELALAISSECLETIARWHFQVVE